MSQKKNFSKYCTRCIHAVIVIISLTLICPSSFAAERLNSKSGKHLLWSVESDRGTVYLLGSIHLMKKDSYPLPIAIENIYNCCSTIVFEADLNGMNDPAVQAKMMQTGLYPPGETLSGNISGNTFALLQERLQGSVLSADNLEQYRPWLVAQTIAGLEFLRLGFDPELGIDRYFFNRAKRDKRDVLFLETTEYQIKLIANMSEDQQEDFLEGILKEIDAVRTLFSEMLEAWKAGDEERLAAILNIGYAEHPDIYNRFIVKRNREWIPAIEDLMKQGGNALIVVGAGHLVGRDSVIDLLKKKSYKVKQH